MNTTNNDQQIHSLNVYSIRSCFLMESDTRLEEKVVNHLLSSSYPAPPRPPVHGLPQAKAAKRLERWEESLRALVYDRQRVKALYEGQGQGSTSEAAKGTAWGFYNAVAEYEDYGCKNSTPWSGLFGSGAKRKERAFQEALA